MNFKTKDNDGLVYKIKDLKELAKHIFYYHSVGILFHLEKDIIFILDVTLRNKMTNFLEKKEKKT